MALVLDLHNADIVGAESNSEYGVTTFDILLLMLIVSAKGKRVHDISAFAQENAIPAIS